MVTAPKLGIVPTDHMAAVRALNRMHRAGFMLQVRNNRLVVSPADCLTAQQDDFIRAHKAALVQLLNDAETVYEALQAAGDTGLSWRESTPAEWTDSRLLAAGEVLYGDGRMVSVLDRRYAVAHRPPAPDIPDLQPEARP